MGRNGIVLFFCKLMISAIGMPLILVPNASHATQFIDLSRQSDSSTRAALRSLLTSQNSIGSASVRSDVSVLRSFYNGRGFEPAWSGSLQASEGAARVRDALADADKLGLDSSQYAFRNPDNTRAIGSGMDAAIYDVSLTDALLRYSTDLLAGRVHPRDVYKDIALSEWNLDVPAALVSALKTNSIASYLETLVPAHPAYRRLTTGLARYRKIAAQGGWSAISAQSTDRTATALYARLAIEDSGLQAITRPTIAQLQEAIKRYQIRNGLTPDGRLGSDLVSGLNVPVTARIQQIIANLERWRWISGEFESRYVAINVPGQTLEFVQDGRVVLNSRVIVGRKGSPTPILRTVAHSLVANPPWDIPADIAADQLLPHLKNNRNYLADHNMVIVNAPGDPRGWNIPWERVSRDGFPYNIRQMPPYSALGVLMLDSPNEFDVYLHDTPGKRFFRDDDREISNGCVRVEQITALASLALTGNPSAGLTAINSAISSRQTREIMLDNPLPIYMLYWTAVADDEGNVGFLPDRYGRDPPLIEALSNSARAANKKPEE